MKRLVLIWDEFLYHYIKALKLVEISGRIHSILVLEKDPLYSLSF